MGNIDPNCNYMIRTRNTPSVMEPCGKARTVSSHQYAECQQQEQRPLYSKLLKEQRHSPVEPDVMAYLGCWLYCN